MEKNKIVKETGIYLIGTLTVSVLGFILSVLYSKMFNPYDYGVYSLVYSTYSLIASVYGGWLSLSMIRNAEKYIREKKENVFFGTFYQLQMIMAIVFIVIGNIVNIFLPLEKDSKIMFFLFTLVYFFEYSILITNTVLRVKQNAKQYSKNTIINNFLKIFFIVFAYYVLNIKNISVIVISLLVAEMFQYIYIFCKVGLKKYYKRKLLDKNIVKKMFLFGFPLIGVTVTTWILNVSDRYIIQFFYSSTEVGLYSYAYSLGNSLFSLLIQFIMLGAYPNIVKAWESGGREQAQDIIKTYLRIYFLIIIPACVGVIGVAKNFFEAFTDVQYQGSYTVFIITCIGIAVLGLTQYSNKAWELKGKTKNVLILNVIAAVINVILNFIFIPMIGYQMGAVTTFVAYVLYLIISLIWSRKFFTLKVDYKSLFKVMLASLVMYISIILVNCLNINVILKLILQILTGIVVYGIMLVVTKELNMAELKNIKNNLSNK